jgi:hypothetical protein
LWVERCHSNGFRPRGESTNGGQQIDLGIQLGIEKSSALSVAAAAGQWSRLIVKETKASAIADAPESEDDGRCVDVMDSYDRPRGISRHRQMEKQAQGKRSS